MKQLKFAAFVFAILLPVTACRGGLDTSIWAAASIPQPVAGTIGVPDGVFSGGGARGFKGSIYVDVTVADDSITNIVVTQHSDTASLARSVFTHTAGMIIQTQSTAVDLVAGATTTARAFVSAVESALVNAGADLDALRAGPRVRLAFTPGTYTGIGNGRNGPVKVSVTFSRNAILDLSVVEHSETEGFDVMAFNKVIPAILEQQSTKVDTLSGATMTGNAIVMAVNAAMQEAAEATPGAGLAPSPLGPFTAGTFEGIGLGGYAGDVIINVTFNEASIIDIEVVQSDETPAFCGVALETLIPRVLEAQTYEVDGHSGATLTSAAFFDALQDAVLQATE